MNVPTTFARIAGHGKPHQLMKSNSSKPELLIDGPRQAKRTLVLAHGAGAAMDSEFMVAIAQGLAKQGLRVIRFEFPYMAERRKSGKQRPPDREPVLREAWLKVLASLDPKATVIGGKSMGGRIASLVADEAGVAGLVCLGYPFHPTGKPEKLRIEHLKTTKTKTLILQGERDPFGDKAEVASYALSRKVKIQWLPDGDHSFKPRKSSGRTQEVNWQAAIEAVSRFVEAAFR